MTLVLEIEFLSGVSFAAITPDGVTPDWPPQPDRIFSALVASWAARGEKDEERRALEWLERLPVPKLVASKATYRTAPPVYVPPNDLQTPKGELRKLKWFGEFLANGCRPSKRGGHWKQWLRALGVIPAPRPRNERNFPAACPHDPVMLLCWPNATPDETTLAALQALAHDTSYIGHSASLTRCHFLLDPTTDMRQAKTPRFGIYEGRFRELRSAYGRFVQSGRKKDRPQKGALLRSAPEQSPARERSNLFADGRDWLILEHVDGNMPDIRACAIVARTMRDALLSGYRQIGHGGNIPEVVSGHTRDGSPSQKPHLAIVPLAFAGFPYADGHVMGFALVPPADAAILARPGAGDNAEAKTFRNVLRKLTTIDSAGRRVLAVRSSIGTPREKAFAVDLSVTFEPPGQASLDPARYTKRARVFATVTPIVFDRHLKQKGEARLQEIAGQIAAACRNIGLPEPEEILVDKHSAIEGAPSAYPSGKAPSWLNWRLPPALASRQLTHAVICFAEPVDGPVILGAGRFVGLGLCLPIEDRDADC